MTKTQTLLRRCIFKRRRSYITVMYNLANKIRKQWPDRNITDGERRGIDSNVYYKKKKKVQSQTMNPFIL